jgi:hypothetical protein
VTSSLPLANGIGSSNFRDVLLYGHAQPSPAGHGHHHGDRRDDPACMMAGAALIA